MIPRTTAFVLGGALLVAAAFPLFNPSTPAAARDSQAHAAPLTTGEPGRTELPPGHPAIGNSLPQNVAPVADDAPAIRWIVPTQWHTGANTGAMRLATYEVPRAPADTDAATLIVSRAGGSTKANAERCVSQFDDVGDDTRTTRTVSGFHITIVEVTGTFLGGGMTPGAKTESRRHWTLLGAIVETAGQPYFFKLLGPAASVRAARPAFDTLIGTIAPR